MIALAALRATTVRILALKQMPRCQACFRPVGEQNPVRGTVGAVTIGCQTCTGDRRK